MASAIPDAAVGFLLQNLVDFIRYNHELISEADDILKELIQDLDFLKEFLKHSNESDRGFAYSIANSVRDLVYRAEDAVQTFIVRTTEQKSKTWSRKLIHCARCMSKIRESAVEIQKIRKEIREFYLMKPSLGLQAMKSTSKSVEYEKLKLAEYQRWKLRVDDTVVGLEDETEKVIGLLTKGTEELDVLTVVGMYGLGKTTLARKVFTDQRIEYYFFIRAFVEVSQEFKIQDVFLKIINSFSRVTEEIRKMSYHELAAYIRKCLENGNYLIVLDDVWTTEAWDKLKSALPTYNKNSRVLITTRMIPVAHHAAGSISEPHLLRFLYADESRELLRLKVFDDPKYCPPDDLVDVEEHILHRCAGLPLAILQVADMLRSKRRDVLWWKQIAHGVIDYDQRVREQTDYIIKLSYDMLPHHLKSCFLYLGVFPEETEISARTLLRLWVSEGLILASDGSSSLEDTAACYLERLIDTSLVIVQKRTLDGEAKTIRIFFQLHEFCKARALTEIFFHEIKMPNMSTDNDRRLCISSDLPDYLNRKPSGKRVHSLLCLAKEDFVSSQNQISPILRTFKRLRVLDMRCVKLTGFPPDLCNLVLLKYIAIFGDLKSLPEKLSNLWNLQTLIVHNSAGTSLAIEADIWKMKELRHLETNASTTLLQPIEGSSNNHLQTLSTISPESCKEQLFSGAPMLKKLGIRGKLTLILKDDSEGRIWSTSLSKLEELENLKLLNDTPDKIRMLPSWDFFPRKLVKFTLLNTLLDWKHMNTIGKLKNLKVLKLKDYAFEGPIWNTEDGGFRNLRVLHIGKTNLSVWKASSSNFPALASLHIRHCSDLLGIPEGLQDVFTLQMIGLYNTNEFLVHSARKFQLAKLQSADNKFKLFVHPPELTA